VWWLRSKTVLWLVLKYTVTAPSRGQKKNCTTQWLLQPHVSFTMHSPLILCLCIYHVENIRLQKKWLILASVLTSTLNNEGGDTLQLYSAFDWTKNLLRSWSADSEWIFLIHWSLQKLEVSFECKFCCFGPANTLSLSFMLKNKKSTSKTWF